MKLAKKALVLLLVLATLVSVIALPAEAATSSITVTSGKTYSLKTNYSYNSSGDRVKNKTYYKLTLDADSVVKVAWSKNTADKASIIFYSNSARDKTVRYVNTYEKTSGSENLALKKGTYYLDMYDGYSNSDYTATTKVTITVTPATEINKSNYCKAKASSLSKDTYVTVAQTPNYSYARWYKIKLTAKQVVTIYTNDNMGYKVRLYDASMNRISCTSGSKKVVSQDKLASGTYYIYVTDTTSFSGQGRLGEYIRLKWK